MEGFDEFISSNSSTSDSLRYFSSVVRITSPTIWFLAMVKPGQEGPAAAAEAPGRYRNPYPVSFVQIDLPLALIPSAFTGSSQ